jgi:small subunit ribosomal protein S9
MPEKVFYATGRRKTSVARVYLKEGKGAVRINYRTLNDYFGRETARMIVLQPFQVTQTVGSFDTEVNVTRALAQVNADFRSPLKKAGFITRDPRAVERKKYGRHKARKRPQYSKR